MPYRKYPVKKQYRKRRRYRKKTSGTNWGSVAKTALKTAKWVAGLVNVEYKYYKMGASLYPQTWNGGIVTLCQPAQGVAADQRTGDSIKLKTLSMRGEWGLNPNGLTAEVGRIIIFLDKENSTVAGNQYLEYTGVYGAVYSEKNQDNLFKTKTLYDKTFVCDTSNPIRRFDIVLKMKGLHMNFLRGTNTPEDGVIKMLLVTQTPTNGLQFTYQSKMTYIDN